MKKELGESDKDEEKEEERETKNSAARKRKEKKEERKSKKREEYDAKDEKTKGVAKGGPVEKGEVSDRKSKKRSAKEKDSKLDKLFKVKEKSKKDEKMDKIEGIEDRKKAKRGGKMLGGSKNFGGVGGLQGGYGAGKSGHQNTNSTEYRKKRIGTKANVALGEKALKKHAPSFNSPAGYRKMAKEINAKGMPKGQPMMRGLKGGLAEYERQKNHGR